MLRRPSCRLTLILLRKHSIISKKTNSRHLSNSALSHSPNDLPLSGVRVLELGQLIAGPFAGQLLGHFGAEVIKIEPPLGGDPLRVWRELDVDGVSPWFRSIGRNKKSVTIDMRKQEGRELVKKLAVASDVVIENFKPGTLEKWKLGPSDLHPHNPDLIFTRVSGYGQTGPWAPRAGYASVCEAESGFRFINGYPDPNTGLLAGAPVRPNISLGDSVAGLHAAFGTVLALLSKGRRRSNGRNGGQVVDVSIMESMLNLMEGIVPEYSRKGKIRGPSGSSVTGIVPTNAYPTSVPSAYIVIGANGDSLYARLMQIIGREDLIGPEYAHNHHRVAKQDVIEKAIVEWRSRHTPDEVYAAMHAANVPVGRIMNAKDLFENEHVAARGMIEKITVGGAGPNSAAASSASSASSEQSESQRSWMLDVPRVAPILEDDAPTRWAGPDLGQHNEEILGGLLGLSEDDLTQLRVDGIISTPQLNSTL